MVATLDSALELASSIGRDTIFPRTPITARIYDPAFNDKELRENWGRIGGYIDSDEGIVPNYG